MNVDDVSEQIRKVLQCQSSVLPTLRSVLTIKCLNLRAFSEQIPLILEHRDFDVVSNSSQITPTPHLHKILGKTLSNYYKP